MWILSWSAAAAGYYTYAFWLDVKRDVSVAPGGVYFWRQICRFHHPMLTTPRGHQAWASPKFFFSAWITDGRLTYVPAYVPAYLRSGLPTRH